MTWVVGGRGGWWQGAPLLHDLCDALGRPYGGDEVLMFLAPVGWLLWGRNLLEGGGGGGGGGKKGRGWLAP